MKYKLLGKRDLPIEITIDESAKEDFKEIMDWNEKEFKMRTMIIRDGNEKEITLL